jgi:antitoxin (DNA-binding transcriptional repressor) of toxin-antitoxin stability system
MADATAPLSEYARRARKGTVVVTRRGRPLAAVVPLGSDGWEDFVVSQDPGFIEVIRRSEARYEAEGGISLEQMLRRHAAASQARKRDLSSGDGKRQVSRRPNQP